jgi:hypothetical protein
MSQGPGDRRISQKGEDRITKEVRHELVTLPYYSVFDDLAYKVDGDTITLYGGVTRPTLKSDAENLDMIGRGSRLKASPVYSRLKTIFK